MIQINDKKYILTYLIGRKDSYLVQLGIKIGEMQHAAAGIYRPLIQPSKRKPS